MAWKYRIRPEQCRACGACAKACAADAIVLRDRTIPDAEMHPTRRAARAAGRAFLLASFA